MYTLSLLVSKKEDKPIEVTVRGILIEVKLEFLKAEVPIDSKEDVSSKLTAPRDGV